MSLNNVTIGAYLKIIARNNNIIIIIYLRLANNLRQA